MLIKLSALVSVLSKQISHRANVCFSAHAIAQPCGHTTSEGFQAFKAHVSNWWPAGRMWPSFYVARKAYFKPQLAYFLEL